MKPIIALAAVGLLLLVIQPVAASGLIGLGLMLASAVLVVIRGFRIQSGRSASGGRPASTPPNLWLVLATLAVSVAVGAGLLLSSINGKYKACTSVIGEAFGPEDCDSIKAQHAGSFIAFGVAGVLALAAMNAKERAARPQG